MGKPLVLLVDDNKAFRELVEIWLADQYELHTANDGREGLQKLETLRPHVVLVDIMMPEMSGVELLRRMREDEDLSKIPSIVVTAYSGLQTEHENVFLKPWLVLKKPFTADTLRECIDAVTRSRLSTTSEDPSQVAASRDELLQSLMHEFEGSALELVEALDPRFPPPPKVHGSAPDVVGYDRERDQLHFGIVETAASLEAPLARIRIRELSRQVMGEGASAGCVVPLSIVVPPGVSDQARELLGELGLSERILHDVFVIEAG